MANSPSDSTADLRPYFDLRTVVRAVWRKRWLIAAIPIVASAVGIWAGLTFGARTYQAETVMHYRPTSGKAASDLRTSLNSIMSQVKVEPNLREIRARLKLPTELDTLSEAIDVTVPRDTTLLVIRAEWDTPELAAAIANTTRDVFLEAWLRSLLTAVDSLLEQALLSQKTTDRQADMLRDVLGQVNAQIDRVGQASRQARADSLRYQSLRDVIDLEQKQREDSAELALRAAEVTRAREGYKKGLVSRPEYDRAWEAFKKQQMITADSGEAAEWKAKLQEIGSRAARSAQDAQGTAPLQDLMLRVADIDAARIAVDDKVRTLTSTAHVVNQKLDELVALRSSDVAAAERDGRSEILLRDIQNQLALARAAHDSESTELALVARATVPPEPLTSNRRLFAIGVAALLTFLGIAGVVLRQILSGRVRSGVELELKSGAPVLGAVPTGGDDGDDDDDDRAVAEMNEAVKVIALALRHQHPDSGVRLAISDCLGGEGATRITTQLARTFGLQEATVVVVDAELHEEHEHLASASLGVTTNGHGGLGTFLSSEYRSIDDIIYPTNLRGVSCVPCDGVHCSSDLLGTKSFGTLLVELSHRFDLVLVDAPATLAGADAAQVGKWCNALVLVARGTEGGKASHIRNVTRALERLESSGVTLAGVVLNRADPYFNG